jgi:hypothetical protein
MELLTGQSTVEAAFATLLRRIELDPTRSALASSRYQAVKETIEAALPGSMVKLIGSFQRKTKIRPGDLSDELDIDLMVILGPFTYYAPPPVGILPDTALNRVRKALASNAVYNVMEPVSDAPVVVLEYADKFTFKIELVPALIDKTGAHDHLDVAIDCYIVPSSSSNVWQIADYDFDAATISAVNQRADVKGMLVPFIKIAKTFLRNDEAPLKSFHVEALATFAVSEASARWTREGLTWGYQHLLAEFLTTASAMVSAGPSKLPGSHSPAVNSDLTATETADVAFYLKNRGAAAWQLCARKDEQGVIEAWRNFFGAPFPTA